VPGFAVDGIASLGRSDVGDDIEKYTKIRRVAPPRAVVSEGGSILVFFRINTQPDADWSSYFHEAQGGEGWRRADVFRRDALALTADARQFKKMVPDGLSGIQHRIETPAELTDATHAIDGFIRAANERYEATHMPAERARREAERQKEEALLATQAELNRIAAELPPPEAS
jgi:hypothetical protein